MSWRTVAKRLDELGRGARTRLAERLDMDRSQLARSLRTPGYPRTDQAAVIAHFLEGRDALEGEAMQPRRRAAPDSKVPLYGFAATSSGDLIAFNEGRIIDWIELPRGMVIQGEFFLVQAIGSSMEPRIWAGERKLVQLNLPPARHQDAVIEFQDGTAVLKTYQGQRDGFVFAQQYNPETQLRYPSSSVKALHAVLSL